MIFLARSGPVSDPIPLGCTVWDVLEKGWAQCSVQNETMGTQFKRRKRVPLKVLKIALTGLAP